MENGRVAEQKLKEEVVVVIPNSEENCNMNRRVKDAATEANSNSFSKSSPEVFKKSNAKLGELQRGRTHISSPTGSPSLETAKLSPISNKPPKVPTETTTNKRLLSRSSFFKPKSRFQEPGYRDDGNRGEETHVEASGSPFRSSPNMASPDKRRSSPITPRTPLIHSPGDGEEDDDDDVYKTADLKVSEKKRKKYKVVSIAEWIAFVCIMGVLIPSLTVHGLQKSVIWGLELWKWCVLVLVVFCGRLFSQWFINVLVFLIERNLLLKKKVLYFVYGLKKSVQLFIWLALVLLTWSLLFNCGVNRSKQTTKILNYVTRGLAACIIGAAICLLKTLLVKLLASSFQSTRFFDRIQESIFHQYVLRTLSGPPVMEMSESIGRTTTAGQLSFRNFKKEKEEEIDVEKLKKMKQNNVSAWTMKGLIDVIRGSGLSTISNMIDNIEDEDGEQKDTEITNEWEAKAAAYQIFKNVAKPGSKYIEEEDLLRFLRKEEVENVLPMFEGAVETLKLKRSSLKNWLVKVYLERKSLAHSLNDTKTAVEELNKLASGIVIVIIIVVWLLLMGLAKTNVLVFISSQLLLVGFMFGNTAKTIFEAIIFVFVMHPFDVGDRCVVDGVQMVVEEMNILTTVFLRYDGEKIFYPNPVLATKPISNFYRSPDMSDAVEFAVDFSTTIEAIGALKAKIKGYLESKPQHWRPGHSVVVKEIENMNKMKIALYITHTMNFQNYGEKSNRRSELVLELKQIFHELNITYHLLPQKVCIGHIDSAAFAAASSGR